MNAITDARQLLRDNLITAGLNVVEYIPERVVPPVVIINAGSPYLDVKSVKDQYRLNLELVLVAATAVNQQASEKLDDLIADVLAAIPNYAVLNGGVGQPYGLGTGNTDYLSANISLNLVITL